MDRVLSSPTKQKALVRLMSSDPSLLDGLDNDVLASITLLSDPPEKAWDRRPTLLKRESRRNNAERKTIQLYPEDAVFAEKKKPTLTLASGGISHAKRATLVRANTVLLSPSSNATALAASTRSKQDGRTDNGFWTEDSSTMRHTSVARRSTFYPAVQRQKPPPVILFDDSMLNVEDRGTKDHQGNGRSGSTKKRAKRMRRRERKLGSSSGSSSNSSTNKSEDESNQQEAEKSRLVSVMMTRGSASVESDSDDGVQAASAITSSVVCDSRLASSLVSRDQWNPRR